MPIIFRLNRSTMLRKIRITLAAVFFAAITLLFLDISGVLHHWLSWLASIQFLPALLAANFVAVAVLVIVTLLFGRIYCSVICPMGVFQDAVAHVSASRKGKKNKYSYSKEKKWLRYGIFVLFVIALIAGVQAFVALLAPYSSYGRMVQNLFAPIYQWGNNILAWFSERAGNYAFVKHEVWIRSLPTFIIAAITFVAVVILAWRNGRTYCNTICPVGTVLSFLSRFAMFRPVIDKSKCKSCHACERKCKASCIDISEQKIDYSRCVDCFNCLDSCKFGALHYRFAWGGKKAKEETAKPAANAESGNSRRAFLIGSAAAVGTAAMRGITLQAQSQTDTTAIADKKRDGGYADIVPKKTPHREVPITPFGSESIKNFYSHCTACQLCVAACPNNVLRPSTRLENLMQPEMSFERGYCRPECVRCSEVCPTGAILEITPEEKSQRKVGTATVNYDLCVVNRDGVECGNCARHCPAGAIRMVRKNPDDPESLMIPSVSFEKCIGCGACEHLCPSNPISAITVNGYEVHHIS